MVENNEHLYRVIKDGKTGFINSKGQIVIDIELDGASSFSEGLAKFFVDYKVGFIDMKGNIVIEPIFDNASDFSEGCAVVTIENKCGYINTIGEVVIPPIFQSASHFKNGIAPVRQEGQTGLLINKTGQIIFNDKEILDFGIYNEGLINCNKNGSWGHINLDGEFVIPPSYKHTLKFSEGQASVTPKKDISGNSNRKNLSGFINKRNEMIIPPIFYGLDMCFSEGFCVVWDHKLFGYINETGTLISSYEFEVAEPFKEGLAAFKVPGKNKKHGYLDIFGNVAIDPIYTFADSFENGLACVIIGKDDKSKCGFIDKNGNYVWEPTS